MLNDTPTGIRTLFADDDIVVVAKPAGIPSVPARTPLDPADVATVLRPTHGDLEAVHRLDRDTTGLLVLARTGAARTALGRSFEAGQVAKRYLAVVRGRPPALRGTIHLPLADDRDHPPRKRVDPIVGRRATTRWAVLADGTTAVGPLALVALEPITGRSHQLRVHLAWLGCPIAGDRLYGPIVATAEPPLALCAVAIDFPHPVSGHRIALTTEPPAAAPWTLFARDDLIGNEWRDPSHMDPA